MNELILGIGTFGHDTSASLINVADGEILYCLTEERFSNRKHDGRFPHACILELVNLIEKKSLGHIAYVGINFQYELFITEVLFRYIDSNISNVEVKQKIKATLIECLPATAIFRNARHPLNYIEDIMKLFAVESKIRIDLLRKIKWYGNWAIRCRTFYDYVKAKFPDANVVSVRHHDCHAASAFYASGYKDSAILTIDGQGEFETITLKKGNAEGIEDLAFTPWPHSLGVLYYDFTWFLGFVGANDEYKVMGMAAYGEPKYLDLFHSLGKVSQNGCFEFSQSELIELTEEVSCQGHFKYTITPAFEAILGGKRDSKDELLQRHFDIACSLQTYVEEMGTQIATCLKNLYPETENLCLAGGVALNGLMNMSIYKKSGFKKIFIQPASSDDGCSLGAALWIYGGLTKGKGKPLQQPMGHVFMGLEYDNNHVLDTLDKLNIKYHELPDIHDQVAELLARGKIVARYTGRSEFGPRALGHRSILASPLIPQMKDTLNERIKHREMFRPFAPACLGEYVSEYFDIDCVAEYMLLICKVHAEKISVIPAVVHQDGTARLQAVYKESNEDFHKILKSFMVRTGVPILINTSFNVNGETIVETPQDAIECFLYTDIDYLAIENYLVSKAENISKALTVSSDEFLQRRKNRYLQKYSSHELYFQGTEFLEL